MHRLLATLARSVAAYLTGQAAAGAQALMVFDTWGGALSPAMYRENLAVIMEHARAAGRADGPGGEGSATQLPGFLHEPFAAAMSQGGFALHMSPKVSRVTGVDSSRPALEVADRNAALNDREIEWRSA